MEGNQKPSGAHRMSKLTLEIAERRRIDDENSPRPPFEKLRPCPFCSSDHLTIQSADGMKWVHCRRCHAEGPFRPDRYYAIQMWNRRK